MKSFLESLEGVAEPSIELKNGGVRIRLPENSWLDFAELESQVLPLNDRPGGKITEDECRRLRESVALYRGDFFEGYHDEWCLFVRTRLKELFCSALERLVEYYMSRGEWAEGLTYGKQVLRQDPLLEHAHRNVMICHWEMGNRTMALRQYAQLVDLLARELDVEPMAETNRLYRKVKSIPRPRAFDVHPLCPSLLEADELPLEPEEMFEYLKRIHAFLEAALEPLNEAIGISKLAAMRRASDSDVSDRE